MRSIEDKNIVNNDIDWIVYDSLKEHCRSVKELKEKSKKNNLSEDENKTLTYHKNRIEYITEFSKDKQVPVVYVPDECFDDKWKKPKSYTTIKSQDNPLYSEEESSEYTELLYPECCTKGKDQKNKNQLVLSMSIPIDAYYIRKQLNKYSKTIDVANPYLPSNKFLITQKPNVNNCWFLSLIIGIIDHNADYIPKKMVRDYLDNNKDEENLNDNIGDDNDDGDNYNVNDNINERPKKAVVRLYDEDGLPVDIVVDKTRPDKDTRPLWMIMLEKAVCVMMGIDKFKNCDDMPSVDMYGCLKGQRTVQGIDWKNIGSVQEDGSRMLSQNDICKNFNIQDIDYGLESVGIKIILGKNNKKLDFTNETNQVTVENVQQHLKSNKLVLIGTGKEAGDLNNADHTLYLKNIDNDRMTTIDSLSGTLNKNQQNLQYINTAHVTDFPDPEKSIENEINYEKIAKIKEDIFGEKDKDDNEEKDNSEYVEIHSNKNDTSKNNILENNDNAKNEFNEIKEEINISNR